MAAHSSIPAWRMPQTEESGGLQPMATESRTELKRLSVHRTRKTRSEEALQLPAGCTAVLALGERAAL